MKRLILVFVVATIFTACHKPVKGRNGEVYKTPVQYNDYIVSRQTDLMKDLLSFGEAADVNLDSADQLLDKSATKIEGMIDEIRGMPAYNGDSTLRDAAINSFTFYKKLVQHEYKQILQLRREGAATNEDRRMDMDAVVKKISVDEEQYDKAFHNAQRDFADKNSMKLTENSMQKQIDTMNRD